MFANSPGKFFELRKTTMTHDISGPVIDKGACPSWTLIGPKVVEILFK